jgi:membrane protease YdiL (CAAX protease family)
LADVGLTLRRFFGDVRLGAAAFALVVPPVLLLQAALAYKWPSKHPLIESLKNEGSPELVFWSVVAAVVAAPVVEEFFFRVVLQGWFERLSASQSPSPPVIDAPVAVADVAPPLAAGEAPAPETSAAAVAERNSARPSFAPVVLSSVLFALAHVGHGPDPVALFFLALGLGYLYRQTHRIWPGIVLHFLLNAFSTLVVMFVPSAPPPV